MPFYCITGANRGLGLEFVRQLSQDNSNYILALTRSLSNDLSELEKVSSSNTHVLECDTGDQNSIKAFAAKAKEILGSSGEKIKYLLNNAGVNSVPQQTCLDLNEDDLQREMRINVIGPAKMVEFLLAEDLLTSDCRIMNMTSGLGSMQVSLGIEPRKCCTYSISKAGVNMLTAHQSGTLKTKLPECVVVCMDPGWVKTRMGGEGAMLEPEESVGGMLKCVHGLTGEDNGKFFTYTGKEVPW